MPPKIEAKCVEILKNEAAIDLEKCQESDEKEAQKEKPAESCEALKKEEEKAKNLNQLQQQMDEISEIKEKRLRKSVRSTRFKAKPNRSGNHAGAAHNANGGGAGNGSSASSQKLQNKARNRRNLYKKQPKKLNITQPDTHVVESIFYKGTYMQVGDIVSLMDEECNVYYAQIRGLLIDSYCEKSAYLTWLIPTQHSPNPREGFDAATYLIGPDEELSRKLSCMEFVMHAPNNYYLDRTTPFPLPDIMEYETRQGGYIWTSLPNYKRLNRFPS